MVEKAIFERVSKLLREGDLSQGKIAEMVGVSRSTVSGVVREMQGAKKATFYRCSGCGKVVIFNPCVVCQAIDYQKKHGL